jgi:hypothetical protein
VSPIDIPAAGTGASATWDVSKLANNTAVNTTLTVPSGVSLGSSQYIVFGIGDPLADGNFTAAGAAMTNDILTVAVPAAYLPNGTLVYNELDLITPGDTYTFAITHEHGYWWSYTYNTNAITGSKGWENGTYNLGVSAAAGLMCEEGATVGPSFVAIAYGNGTAATPSMPTTSVSWAIGVEPEGSSTISYVPQAANTMPQFNASLGLVGIQGHNQNSAIGINHLKIGAVSSVPYPGAFTSLWGNYKVNDLNTSKVTPITASVAYNATQEFNATAINQNGVPIPGAKFAWQISPAALGTLSTTKGPSSIFTAGSITISGMLWVNVSYNCSFISDVASITVTKTGGPTIDSFTVSPTPIVVSDTSVFNVTNGSWQHPITYHYVGLPSGCTSVNSSTLTCTPAAAGNFTVRVYLNDSFKHSSDATTNLLVYPVLAGPVFTVTPTTLTENTTTTLNVSVVGGIPPLTYEFTGLPAGCPDGRQPANFVCRPTEAGNFTPTVFINDSASHSVSKTSRMVVNVKLSIADMTASPSDIPLGGTTYINVTAAGGTSPYKYNYTKLPPGCKSANTAKLVCTPTLNGTFLIDVNVTDASGFIAPGSTLLFVNAPTTLEITSFQATPSTITQGNATTISATVGGGVAPYTYLYAGLPGGCTGSNQSSFVCSPSAAGSFKLNLTVTDSRGIKVYANANLTVNSKGGPLTIASFTASPGSVPTGGTTYLNVSVTGGTTPYSYTYTGLPAGCSSTSTPALSCTPTLTGTYTVTVFVNDSAGHSVKATASLTVTAVNNSGPSGSSNTLLIIVIVVVVIAVVAVVAIIFLRKKKQPSAVPPPQPAYGAPQQPYMVPPPQQQSPPPYRP